MSKFVRFNTGQQEMVLPQEDFIAYMANLSDSARARVKVEGKHDAVYQNQDGELVRESISGDQVNARMGLGEQPMVTGSDDPKLQAQMRQQAAREKKATAAEEGLLAFTNSIAPVQGATALLTDMDPKEIDQGFNEIAAANRGESIGGMFTLGMGAGSMAMSKLAKMGITAKSGRGLGLAAHVAVDEAAFETATYTNYIMNTRQDFQAEELAQNIVQGMMFAAPVVGGALLRKPIWNAVSMVGGGMGRGIGHVQSGLVAAGLKTTDPAKASKYRRAAAVTGIGRRLFSGRKAVTQVDELAELRKAAAKEELAIGRATPEALKGNKLKRDEILDTVRKNMDQKATYLDNIDVGTMAPNLGKVRTAGRQAQNAIWGVNRNVSTKGVIGVGKLGKTATSHLESSMDNFLGRADDMGLGDLVGHLRDVKGHTDLGMLFQARLDLKLKGAVGNQSTELLELELKAITENPLIWGSGKAAEQARNMNDGMEALVDGFKELKRLDIPDDLSKIPDGTNLDALDGALGKIRKGADHLHASKVFTTKQKISLEATLNKVEDALVEGKRAYVDAVKLNKARASAAKNHKARYDKLKAGDVETVGALEARMEGRMFEWANDRTGLIKALAAFAKSGRIPVFSNRMLKTLRESTMQEKEDFFMEMQERLPMLVSNPEIMASSMEPFMAEAPQNPTVHAMAGVAAGNATYFLMNKLGRVDRTLYGKGRKPRRDRVLRFVESYAAMASPMDVAYAAVAGEVTQDMIDAVRVGNPAQYAELGQLLSAFVDNVELEKLPRKSQQGINKFLGGMAPIFMGPALIQLQSNYAQNEQQNNEINGQGGGGLQGQFNQDHPQDGDNAFTFTQRLMSY
jgi:hypothetical protein